MFYAFAGAGTLNGGKAIRQQQICRFDTTKGTTATATAGPDGLRMMVFTGKMNKEMVVWHGPFVCDTKDTLMKVFRQRRAASSPGLPSTRVEEPEQAPDGPVPARARALGLQGHPLPAGGRGRDPQEDGGARNEEHARVEALTVVLECNRLAPGALM